MLTPPSPAELPDTLCRSTLRLLQEEYPGITRMWPVIAQIGKLARRISPTSDEDEVNINVNRTLVQQRAQLR